MGSMRPRCCFVPWRPQLAFGRERHRWIRRHTAMAFLPKTNRSRRFRRAFGGSSPCFSRHFFFRSTFFARASMQPGRIFSHPCECACQVPLDASLVSFRSTAVHTHAQASCRLVSFVASGEGCEKVRKRQGTAPNGSGAREKSPKRQKNAFAPFAHADFYIGNAEMKWRDPIGIARTKLAQVRAAAPLVETAPTT